MKKLLIIILWILPTIAGVSCASVPVKTISDNVSTVLSDKVKQRTDFLHSAEDKTGIPAALLFGIMMRESGGKYDAIGDNGNSIGLMQINEKYRNERIKLCGYEYDPKNPRDAVYVSALILQQNKKVFSDNIDLLIASYRQGVNGVIKNGITNMNYVNDIKNYMQIYEELDK